MIDNRMTEWYERIGKKILVGILIIFCIYIIIRLKILTLFAPFILAWIFATFLNVFVTWANNKLKISRGIATIVSMLTILSAVLYVIAAVLKQLWVQIVGFANHLPSYVKDFTMEIQQIEIRIGEFMHKVPVNTDTLNLDTIAKQFSEHITSLLGSLVPTAYGAVSKVPNILIFIIFTVLATFFMTRDYNEIKDFVKAQFSDTIVDHIVIMQKGVLKALGGYIRTQVILMSITFMICLIGLAIFRRQYALLIALIIAFVDALPVFGSGTILIPWAIYNMIIGKYSLGIGLLSIYGIIFVMRQIMEPKILSTQIGIYALNTIMAVYVGYKLLGFAGLIVGPVIVVVFTMLQSVGALPAFKKVHKTEEEVKKNEGDSC